jgi:hypothetical protein
MALLLHDMSELVFLSLWISTSRHICTVAYANSAQSAATWTMGTGERQSLYRKLNSFKWPIVSASRKAIIRRAEAKPEARLALPNKSRKRRSDRGTGKRLRQFAALMCKGFGYVRIAESIGIKPSTARGYCREVKARGGPDQIGLQRGGEVTNEKLLIAPC